MASGARQFNKAQSFFDRTIEACDELWDELEMLIEKEEYAGNEEFNFAYANEVQNYLRIIQEECEEAKGILL